jgi:hypothetical protein
MSELSIPGPVLEEVRSALSDGRATIEDVAGSAPASVDAGEMTAMILGMLAKVVDNAATVSEALAAVGAQVAEAEAEFWEVDTSEALRYKVEGLR